jgi:hypothetical protein
LDTAEIIREVLKNVVVKIDRDDLAALLEQAEVVREDDTTLAGWIRILSLDGHVLVQEETPDREVLVRKPGSIGDANRLVDGRLADYERMWDGCGCKIDYMAPTIDE